MFRRLNLQPATRFADDGEIEFAVMSLVLFAPWVDKSLHCHRPANSLISTEI